MPLVLLAGCAKTPAKPAAVAPSGAAVTATAANAAGAAGTAAQPAATAAAKPGTAATTTTGTATKPGATPAAPAATAPSGTKASQGTTTQAAPSLESLLLVPGDLGDDWNISPEQADAEDQSSPHSYCHGPFKTDAQRLGRKQRGLHQDDTNLRVEEEVTRYKPGGAKAALAEFRENFKTCTTWGTPPDFTATFEGPADAPRIGQDSSSMRVRYSAGPYVLYSVLTVAIQDDHLLFVSTIAEKYDKALMVAKQANPAAAIRARFDF